MDITFFTHLGITYDNKTHNPKKLNLKTSYYPTLIIFEKLPSLKTNKEKKILEETKDIDITDYECYFNKCVHVWGWKISC